MQYLFHDLDEVLTSDAAAAALGEYADCLARSWCADEVTVPVIDQSGFRASEQFLLGPASVITALRAADDVLEADDHAFVRDMAERMRTLRAAPRLEDRTH
jgi:hypothetical protein